MLGPGGPGTQSPPAPLMEPCCPSPLQLAPGVNSGQGLGIEIIGTLQLVLCVLATTDRRRRDLGGSAPLAIGLSVALGHLLAVSGGSPQVGVGMEKASPDRGCQGVLYWAEEGTTHCAHSMGGRSQLCRAAGQVLPRRGEHRDPLTFFLGPCAPSFWF